MRGKFKFIIGFLFLFIILINLTAAEDIYITNTTVGGDSGADCSNAHSASWFNTGGNWGAGAGKISAGDTVHLCGKISTPLTAQGSGSAGNSITIFFETNAELAEAECPGRGGGCLTLDNNNYIIVDGGINGTIENTKSGTGMLSSGSYAIEDFTSNNIEIRNLTIKNMYIHNSTSDTSVDETTVRCIAFDGSNFSIHDNVMHDIPWCIVSEFSGNDKNISIYNNNIYNVDHGFALTASGPCTPSGIYFYNNHVHDYANWDSITDAYHHDGIHAYGTDSGGYPNTTGFYIYDNIFDGDVGNNITAHIFLEGGSGAGSTPWTQHGTVYIYDNVLTANRTVNNGLIGSFAGTSYIYNNFLDGHDWTLGGVCLGIQGDQGFVKNNIITGCDQLVSTPAGIFKSTADIDYNVYGDCKDGNCWWIGTVDTGSFSEYRSSTGYDNHSIDLTALSNIGVNASGYPNSTFPGINNGTNLSSLYNTDILGVSRPQGSGWDMGAYEYVSSDTIYPSFSNYSDNNGSLSGSGVGKFNVTLQNTNGTVLLQINGVNVTAKNITANIYNASYTFSTNGTYSYNWLSWGNGSSNNFNISDTKSYSVNGVTCEATGGHHCWYVDGNLSASGTHDGTSWATAWRNLTSMTGLSAGDYVYISGGSSGSNVTYTLSADFTSLPGFVEGTAGNPVTYKIGQDAGHNGIAIFHATSLSSGWLYTGDSNFVISGDAGDNQMHFQISNYLEAWILEGSSNITLSYINLGKMPDMGTMNPITGININHCYIYVNDLTADHDLFALFGYTTMQYDVNLFHDNTVYVPSTTTGDGFGTDVLQFEGYGYSVYNNTFIEYGAAYTGSQHQDGVQTEGDAEYIKIYNNRFVDMQNYPIFLEPYGGGFAHVRIYNNIMLMTVYDGTQAIAFGGSQASNYTVQDVVIANNLADNFGSAYNIRDPDNSQTTNIFLNDYFYNNIVVNSTLDNNLDPNITQADDVTVTSAQALSDFLNWTAGSASNDYHLKSSATTLINQGINLYSNFTTDKDGVSRPQGSAWDIGPYEYVGNGTTSNVTTTLNSPANGLANKTGTNIIFNCSASDSGGSLTNITLYGNWTGSWQANQTKTITGVSNSTTFVKNLSNGNYIWNCLAYDSNSNSDWGNSNYTLTIDTVNPGINITYPQNNSNFTSNIINVNYTVSDNIAVGSCWYSNDTYSVNTTLAGCANITGVTWNNGFHNVTIWVNDTAGNLNSSKVSFNVSVVPDTIYPIFSSYWDNNASLNNSGTGLFNVTLTNTNGTVLLEINGVNVTAKNITDNIFNASYTFSSSGTYSYHWDSWGNGSSHNFNVSDTRSYTVNAISPNINFTSPTPANGTTQSTASVYVNVSSSDASDHSVFLDWNKNLLLWMSFDSVNASNDPTDLSSYSKNGSKVGGSNATYSSGARGNALTLNGGTAYVQVPSDKLNLNNTAGFTISAWINPKTFGTGTSFGRILDQSDFNTQGYYLTLNNDGVTGNSTIELELYGNASSCPALSGSQAAFTAKNYAVNLNQWQYVAVTYNKTDVVFYVNGTSVNSASFNYTCLGYTMNASTLPLMIGNAPTASREFNGSIDEVMIFNRTLSVNEILALYNASANQYYHNFTNLTAGTYTYKAYAIDSSGNVNSTETRSVTISSDASYPTFSSYWDNNGSLANSGTGLFNVTLTNTNGTVLLEINGTNITAKNSTDNIFNASYTFSSSGTYSYHWDSWGNGTSHNFNTSNTRSYTVNDTIPPNIVIIYPSNNTNTTNTQINVNYTASDNVAISSCWYSNDSAKHNTSLANCGNITGVTWLEGVNNITIWVNDTSNNVNSSSVKFTVDTTKPAISIIFPTNNTNFSSKTINVNYTASDSGTGLGSCWYSNDSAKHNTTLSNCANITGVTWLEGVNNVTIWANDSVGNTNYTSVRFMTDTIQPNVIILSPSNNTNSSNNQLGINYSKSDIGLGVQACWYSNDSFTVNNSLSNCANITGITWSDGTHTVRVYANDSVGNTNYSAVTFSIDTKYPIFSNYWDNNGSLTNNGTGMFNVTLTNTNGTVLLEINGVNVTAKNSTDNIFNASYFLPSSGNYNYKWYSWGNGTSSNFNKSDVRVYTVNGSYDIVPPTISIIFPSNNTNTSNTQINVNYTASDNIALFNCWWSNDSFTKNISLTNCGTNITGINWSVGTHNVRVYANDTSGNINNASVKFTIDLTPPNIQIVLPLNNTNSSNNNLDVNYTASDNLALFNCWYSNDSFTTNNSLDGCVNLTWATWNDGAHNVIVYANDSAGNINSSSVSFYIDTTPPNIIISSPANNTNSSNNNLDVNYTASDIGLGVQSCWYSNDSFTVNNSLANCINLTAIVWSDGTHNVIIYSNDTVGNVNYSSITFGIDTTNPRISIIFPSNNTNSSNKNLNVNYTATDSGLGLNSCWYSNDSFTVNNSLAGCSNITGITWNDGTHNIRIYANDTVGNTNSSSVSFYIDTTPPYFTNLQDQNLIAGQSLNYDINAADAGVGVQSFAINWTTNFSIVASTGVLTNTSGLGIGNYYINVSVNDTLGNLNSSILLINVTGDTTPPVVTLVSPSDGSTWSSSSTVTFTYNVTDDSNIANCSLIINGAINDGTGTVTKGTSQAFADSLSNGNYNWNINCTDVFNNQGNSSISSLTVSYTAPGGGSGGGGGGGGGTPVVNNTNVNLTQPELDNISITKFIPILNPQSAAILVIANSSFGVYLMQVGVNSEADNSAITITRYYNTPAFLLVNQTKAYQYFQITTQNISSQLENAIITLWVAKNWTSANSVDKNNVGLFYFNGSSLKWIELNTTYSNEDENYYYYQTTSDLFGYSYIGEKLSAQLERNNRLYVLIGFGALVAFILAGIIFVGSVLIRKIKKAKLYSSTMREREKLKEEQRKKDLVIELLKRKRNGLMLSDIVRELKLSRKEADSVVVELKGAGLIKIGNAGEIKLINY